ncbi:MAG: ABC transporter substrate-binding protein [Ruminococcaceae bacterium]|nr:ABC transporter substrate-binding protein [Oscillospiraceae bacterium]
MRRALALILALVMTMALVACGGDKPTTSTPGTDKPATSTPGTQDIGDINKDQQVTVEPTKTYKKEIAVAVANQIAKLDPQTETGTNHQFVYKMMYNQLLDFDFAKNELVPELAESWEIENAGSYVFHLRKGVKFSNGEPLTADDVVYSFERYFAAKKLNDKVEAVDEDSVRITLASPNADYLYTIYVNDFSVFNREACEKDAENGHWIGTGGWAVSDFFANEYVALTRVDDSWVWAEKGLNPTEKVTIRTMKEASARTIALQTGEIAIDPSCSATTLKELEKDTNVRGYSYNAQNLYYMGLNLTNGKLSEDINLRKAVAYALNYGDIVKLQTDGRGQQAVSMWGKNQYGYTEDLENIYTYDPAKAKEYMAKAGYANGGPELTLLTGNIPAFAALVQANLQAVGFKVNIKQQDSTGFNATITERSFDMFLYSISLRPDATRLLSFYKTTGRPGYDNPEMLDIYAKIAAETDDAKRTELCKQAQEISNRDLPYIPLYYIVQNLAYNKNVSGIQFYPNGFHDYTHIRWEE